MEFPIQSACCNSEDPGSNIACRTWETRVPSRCRNKYSSVECMESPNGDCIFKISWLWRVRAKGKGENIDTIINGIIHSRKNVCITTQVKPACLVDSKSGARCTTSCSASGHPEEAGIRYHRASYCWASVTPMSITISSWSEKRKRRKGLKRPILYFKSLNIKAGADDFPANTKPIYKVGLLDMETLHDSAMCSHIQVEDIYWPKQFFFFFLFFVFVEW